MHLDVGAQRGVDVAHHGNLVHKPSTGILELEGGNHPVAQRLGDAMHAHVLLFCANALGEHEHTSSGWHFCFSVGKTMLDCDPFFFLLVPVSPTFHICICSVYMVLVRS